MIIVKTLPFETVHHFYYSPPLKQSKKKRRKNEKERKKKKKKKNVAIEKIIKVKTQTYLSW